MESLYRAILGVSENASEEEVAKAYQKLTVNRHPVSGTASVAEPSTRVPSSFDLPLVASPSTSLPPLSLSQDGNPPELGGAFPPESFPQDLSDNLAALHDLVVSSNAVAVGWGPVGHGIELPPGVAAEAWELLHGAAPVSARMAVAGGWAPTWSADGEDGAAGLEATADVVWRLSEHPQQGKQEVDTWRDAKSVYTATRKRSQSCMTEDSDSDSDVERVYKGWQYGVEDPERRAKRLAAQAARAAQRRAEETLEQRAKRLAADAARAARKRAEEDLERRAQRLKADAERAARKRAQEDPERRTARRAAQAARAAQRRAEETLEQRAKRLAADAARAARKRAEEDLERRAQRLKADAERAARRRAEEDPERRAARRAAQAARAAQRRAEARGRHKSVGTEGSIAGTEDPSEVETGMETVIGPGPGRGPGRGRGTGSGANAHPALEAKADQNSSDTEGTGVTENMDDEEQRQWQRQGITAAAGYEGTCMRDLAMGHQDQNPAVDEARCGRDLQSDTIGHRTMQPTRGKQGEGSEFGWHAGSAGEG
ncbi:hypothetical protein Vafri_8035 [Volvox africanus]|uniref:STPR domain-containing protein n=1 Tax=Volvox africanus TaxID=51714 RepID=A0A8J4B1D3_9CHLO|nr:hypothetical protein Vafri_8035 [Volvox africanus]